MLSIPIAVGTGTWGIAAVIPKYLSLRLHRSFYFYTMNRPLIYHYCALFADIEQKSPFLFADIK